MHGRNLERMGLLLAGSVSAGVHAGLAPAHLREWPPLGAAFVVAAVTVSLAVAVFAFHPADRRAAHALVVLLAGLVAAYASTRLAALPPLDPTREPLDGLGVATSAIEALGLLAALRLIRPQLALSRGGTP